jgi:predicted RNA-binding Zn-ribbon protein involved in translation (DUF1610 family)
MTTFRYKPDRIKHLTISNTLDTVHRERVCEFELRRKKISNLKSEMSTIEYKLSQLEKPESKGDANAIDSIKQRSQLKTQFQKIRQELFDIENNVSELEYYSQTSEILHDYYNEAVPVQPISGSQKVEFSPSIDMASKQDPTYDAGSDRDSDTNGISGHFRVVHGEDGAPNSKSKLDELNLISQKRRKPKKVTRRRLRKTDVVNPRSILDYLNKSDKKDTIDCAVPITEQVSVEQIVSNKATLFDDYMTIVDKTYVSKEKKNTIRMCSACNVEMTLIQSEGLYVCQKCGEVEYVIIESEVPSHKDSVVEKSRYPYKRLNHLTEWSSVLWIVISKMLSGNF